MQIRDVRTGSVIGIKNNDYIFVPENEQVHNFVSTYNALTNYDMGMVAELYDPETKKVDRFVVFYSFKEHLEYTKGSNMKVYRVLEATLTNLDVLEIIHQHNHLNDSKEKDKK